jgi:protease-4
MVNWIKSALGWAWRALDVLRRVVHLFLMLIVLLVIVALLSQAPVLVPESAALVINPSGRLVEQLAGNPADRAIAEAQGQEQSQTLVRDVVIALDRARDDKRIRAALLDLDGLGGGDLTKLGQIAEAVARFRESGKPVIAAGDAYSQAQYYLAASADEVYMNPRGGILFRGFGYYRMFFREALEKLSIDWHVFRVGEFKSGFDSFVRDDMSEGEKAEARVFLDQLWASYRGYVAERRDLAPEDIQRYADNYLSLLQAANGDDAQAAQTAGLVDGLLTRDEIRDRMIDLVGREDDGKGFRKIRYGDYLSATDLGMAAPEAENEVAVIVAAGEILGGDQPPGLVGDESLPRLIREAREDEAVKALVLRVDSPGGSQFASDIIARELELFRDSGKPIVVSMAGVAASGGYVISLPGNEIWAHPDTITGSIGVLAMFPSWDRALARLGVRVDGIGTTRYSGDYSPARGLSDEAKEVIQISAENGYEHFLSQVATARGLDTASVRRVAGGRTWTGRDALDLGLIDRLGDQEEAIARAAELAGLGDDYEVRFLERPLSFDEVIAMRLFAGAVRWTDAVGLLPRADRLTRTLDRVRTDLASWLPGDDPAGLYYHCLCRVE